MNLSVHCKNKPDPFGLENTAIDTDKSNESGSLTESVKTFSVVVI